MAKKLIIVTNAAREYMWEDSYTRNLSGVTDVIEKVAENPAYRRGDLCLVHPAIARFYKTHKTNFEEQIKGRISAIFPPVIDKRSERAFAFPVFNGFQNEEFPALVCETEVGRGMFGEEKLDSINGKYILIPFRPEETAEVDGFSLNDVIRAYEQSKMPLSKEGKSAIRQKLALLKSFDLYLHERAIRIRDIPVEITCRQGEIDRTKLRKYTR